MNGVMRWQIPAVMPGTTFIPIIVTTDGIIIDVNVRIIVVVVVAIRAGSVGDATSG
jgi:hypothetical protein